MRELEIGAAAYDERVGRYGVVMDHEGGRVYLRPPGGGLEWEAAVEHVRPARVSEVLAEPVAEANARSRGERL
ncbi:hypothetical protein [Streptomyces hainanensis]|uniref:Uncharacterized protein n=1 Tax=Streptomyces hainanensis TaxID=402648 RepID=A0A4R4TDJ7_9ACTN|nr:hypothetical protein [Streptomyces hainanensis]TDC74236.1 hypothetical protein E1283_16420 [Streptomyces hainanensis]